MTPTTRNPLRHLCARLAAAIQKEVAAACGHTFPELDHKPHRDHEAENQRGAA
jgi:hypothetical protein